MQRKVYSTKFSYVESVLKEDGSVDAKIATIMIHESDEEKALKKAYKQIGYFKPVKTEQVSELYVIDDETFFKYATVKED